MQQVASISGAGSDVMMALAPYVCEAASAAMRQVAEVTGGAFCAGSGFAVPRSLVVVRLGVANHVPVAAAPPSGPS